MKQCSPVSELLPCPFCGGSANFERMGNPRQSCIVACDECGCRLETNETWAASGRRWNNRISDARSSAGSEEPAAYLHTLHMELGQTQRELMWTEPSPFGIPGKHYDATYTVSCAPLYLNAARPSTVREALELAEDVLSRSPFSTDIWPNGMHPNTGIKKIRDAISSLSSPGPLAGAIAEYARDLRRNPSGGDDYPWETMRAVADALEEILNYSGGAESPLHDEYVMDRAKAALSALSSPEGK